MKTFNYNIEVRAETQEQADQVIIDRVEHDDDDLGFEYEIDWERPVDPKEHRTPGPGCPFCGRTDAITVIADCTGNVEIEWDNDNPRTDTVEWGIVRDVDIEGARAATCSGCGWHMTVEGDQDLFDKLGLERA